MLKVGDKIKLLVADFGLPEDEELEILDDRGLFWEVLSDKKQHYYFRKSNEDIGYELISIPIIPGIKIGDRIKLLKYQNPNQVGDILEVYSKLSRFFLAAKTIVSPHSNIQHPLILSESRLDIEYEMYVSQNLGWGHTQTANINQLKYSYQFGYDPGLSVYNSPYVVKINTDSNTHSCKSNLLPYTGLSTRYEFCTVCDTKFNERGIWE